MCSCVRGYHVNQAVWIPVIGELKINAYSEYEPRFFDFSADCNTFSTSRFTEYIALDGMEPDCEPFRSGRPSIGLKYCRIDMLTPSTAMCALTS